MAYSAPLYMEVRWRLLGSDEAWSEPRRVSPVSEVVVEELDRTKQYEFEARNVSACGAKSDWVLVSHTVPDYSPGNINLGDLQTEVASAAADAAQANADLARIASNNMLTTGEKPTVIRDYNVIVTEQAGIDAQATAFSITTEKTAYDAKVTALVNYINTLASPTDWNDLTGDTTIDGPTFRAAFADVYTSRQALLNKIYAAAKKLADDAQKDVDDLAAEQYCYNPTFRIGLSGWTSVFNGAGFYTEAGDNSPDPNTATYLVREGQASPFLVLMENTGGGLPVHEGQGVTASIALRAVGTNASALAYARIEWLDKNRASIGNASAATGICSLDGGTGHFTQGVSRVKGTAPAGACYAIVTIEYDGHTSGIFTATKASIGYTAANLDEVDDSDSYQRAMPGFHSETVDNATFSAPIDKNGNVPGWKPYQSATLGYFAAAAYNNANVLDVSGTTTNFGAETTRRYPCKPGDYISAYADVYSASGDVRAKLQVRFYQQDGTAFTEVNGNFYDQNTAFTTWQTLNPKGTAPANAAYFSLLCYNPSTTGTGHMFMTNVRVSVNDVRVSGSGVRLGDLRNQVMAGVGSFASGWSGGGITYSSTSTSATITMGAATLRAGDDSIAYSQASTSVSTTASPTGKSITYYLYLDDDDYTGGSKTLHATTTEITTVSANGRVYVGKILVGFPSSGTSSGSGGVPCPDESAWVLRADPNGIRPDWLVRAKEVEAGHFLRLTDGTAGLVTYSQRKAASRVRVVDENGWSLTCSTSAPLELAGTAGECILAPDAAGQRIKALFVGEPVSAAIERVDRMDDGWVQHITCQNACFWTGDDPGHLFGHHNMKQVRD